MQYFFINILSKCVNNIPQMNRVEKTTKRTTDIGLSDNENKSRFKTTIKPQPKI